MLELKRVRGEGRFLHGLLIIKRVLFRPAMCPLKSLSHTHPPSPGAVSDPL